MHTQNCMSKSRCMLINKVDPKILSLNRKATFHHKILSTWEAGISLLATEAKSIFKNNFSIKDSYASIEDGEAYILNMNVSNAINIRRSHDPLRKRKLLLHKKEIHKMIKGQDKSHTLIPLQVHLVRRKIKVVIALCEGKSRFDKRRSIKEKEQRTEMRLLSLLRLKGQLN